MKISIVTISFNQKQYLQQCIESILSQTDCDLEYIVVDPGSTDGSRELIESYGASIIKVFEPDNGPADGLIKGFGRATGDIYGFINSDDYLLAGALGQATNYFNTNGLSCFVTGLGYTEDDKGRLTKIYPRRLTRTYMLHRAAVLFQQATFFPAALYKQVGGFNSQNATCWDYELFLELLLAGAQHEVLEYDMAVFRLHPASISGSGRLTNLYLQDLDKLFFKVYGRKRALRDRAFTTLLRVKRELGRLMSWH